MHCTCRGTGALLTRRAVSSHHHPHPPATIPPPHPHSHPQPHHQLPHRHQLPPTSTTVTTIHQQGSFICTVNAHPVRSQPSACASGIRQLSSPRPSIHLDHPVLDTQRCASHPAMPALLRRWRQGPEPSVLRPECPWTSPWLPFGKLVAPREVA